MSDLHGYLIEHDLIPDCDLLILAGDLCYHHDDYGWYIRDFGRWLEKLSRRMKVIGVAGNHDFMFQNINECDPEYVDLVKALPWTYLQDGGTTFKGWNIYGTPWQPTFYSWAFNAEEDELAKKWAKIPEETSILVLHGPPFGFGDINPKGEHVGSRTLEHKIAQLHRHLKLAVFGHIHSGHGTYRHSSGTLLINASLVDEKYRLVNGPTVVELSGE